MARQRTVARDPAGIMIFATMLAVNFVGDGLRDALDFRN